MLEKVEKETEEEINFELGLQMSGKKRIDQRNDELGPTMCQEGRIKKGEERVRA